MRGLRPALVVSLLLLSACAAETEPERVGATGQAIIGGATSTTAQDAAVMLLANGQQWCTGTLIAPNLVLTARHCVAADLDESSPCGPARSDMAASAFSIALGVNTDATKKVGRGKKLFVPATNQLCGADIALIQLDADVTNAKIARVRFEKVAAGETTVAVGFGSTTTDGPTSRTRRQRQTTVQAIGPASAKWSTKSGQSISYEVAAGDVSTGESTCIGDSGGPLFDEAGSVIAVTSRGIDGECVDRPGLYAGVAAHAKLIGDAAAAAGHALDTLSDGEPGGEGDPGDDDATSKRGGASAARRSYQPQPSAGCSAAPARPNNAGFGLLAAFAVALAASFRRLRRTK